MYRILKGYDLVTSPVFQMVSAKDAFDHTPKRVNKLGQTDFTPFTGLAWGYCYLCTVLDDYSRYILAWRLAATLGSQDVEETLPDTVQKVGVKQVKVAHRPRLLSDNGPAFVSVALKQYLKNSGCVMFGGHLTIRKPRARSSATIVP